MNRARPMPLASRHWARARTADAEQLDQLERVLLVRRRVRVDQVRLHQRVLRAWTRAGMAFPMIAARYSDDQYPLFRMPTPHYQLPLIHIMPTPHSDYQLLVMPHSQCPPLAHPLRSLRKRDLSRLGGDRCAQLRGGPQRRRAAAALSRAIGRIVFFMLAYFSSIGCLRRRVRENTTPNRQAARHRAGCRADPAAQTRCSACERRSQLLRVGVARRGRGRPELLQ